MKKITILSLHLGFGGIEKCITSLANALCSKYDVEIACCYKLYEKPAFDIDKRVSVVYLNDESIIPNHDEIKSAIKSFNIFKIIKEGFYSLKVLYYRRSRMISFLKKCESDVVISTRDIFNFWASKYLKNNIIKIGWEHNHFHDNYKYAEKIVKSVSKLDYFVLVSSDLKKYYEEKLKDYKVKCIYIPNSIDEVPKDTSDLKEKNFISVGRLSPEKGYMDLFKIMKDVFEIYPDWHLDIIGDGSEKTNLDNYIKSNKLSKNIKLHGFQKKDYINKMLHNSSIYLMSSYTEAFGIVLIEAMSHGVPCIAFSSAEGAREIIEDGVNGYLINNRDSDEMINKIKDLVESISKRKKMGEAARKSIVKYTGDVVFKQWFKLIEESDFNE